MAKYRSSLPQLSGDLFLTDGGIETTLIFHEGLELAQQRGLGREARLFSFGAGGGEWPGGCVAA